jgi:hypothetical protein
MKKFDSVEKAVAKHYGIDDEYLKWARDVKPSLPYFITEWGTKPKEAEEQKYLLECCSEMVTEKDEKLIKYCKFYSALMTLEILKETPMPEICDMFKCQRGNVQSN